MPILTSSHYTCLSNIEFPHYASEVNSVTLEKELENEIKFLVHDDSIKRHFDPVGSEKIIIEQRYFPKEEIERIWAIFTENDSRDIGAINPNKFKQARIRKITSLTNSESPDHYELTFKTSKAGRFNNVRSELTTAINLGQYCELLKLATAGFIEKERLVLKGKTHSGGHVSFEIDYVTAAGVGETFREYDKSTWPYFQVGCEVTDDATIRELLSDSHDYDFLKEGRLINGNKSLSSPLSMKNMAQRGIEIDLIMGLIMGSADQSAQQAA